MDAWRGFKSGKWNNEINVRSFIHKNFVPYYGNESFLAGPTERTLDLWSKVSSLKQEEIAAGGVLDMDTKVISTILSHGAGYIDKDKEQIVGLQTDSPMKRALHPYGGIRMAVKACKDNGYDVDPEIVEFFTTHRKTHNAGLYGDKKYNVNTAAKCINTLVTILGAAEAEGHHNNVKCLSRQFRAKRKEVDNVYLTKEELQAMMDADLSHLSRVHEVARDIFMVGVYTAQRVSDYNNIARENIVPGPDGELIIRVRQKKTGTWVTVPVKEELRQILVKYDYRLPRVAEQSINACIKEVAKAAGVDTPVSVETTSGGVVAVQVRPKYELVHTHTARRTGATLMYLAGMDVFNICSVTGHSSIAMLKKYIKSDEIDRARTIRSDAAFAKW